MTLKTFSPRLSLALLATGEWTRRKESISTIEALPTDIPDTIHVDVSGLEIAATMHLSEISAPQGVTFLDDPHETVIATVSAPIVEVEPEPEEGEELAEGEAAEGDGEAVEGEAAGGAEPTAESDSSDSST